MSDFLPPTDPTTTRPDWLARLREARFVSPGGTESRFLFDTLTRSVGKKATAHEIADSNDSVLQDLGTATRSYPLDVFFVGNSYDTEADVFFESLAERYTPDNPGILHHPRWGDIPVMPFSFEQTESFTTRNGGIARLTVEFRQTKSLTYPASDALSESTVNQQAGQLRDDIDTVSEGIDVEAPSAYARFKAGLTGAIDAVTGAVDSVTGLAQDVQDEVDSVTADIYRALDLAAAPAQIMGQIGSLVFGVADAVLSTPGRINSYFDMTVGVVDSLVSRFESLVSPEDREVAAQSLQAVGGLATAATAVAVLNTEFETREDVGDAIDNLVVVLASYREGMDTVQSGLADSIKDAFIPDSNVQSLLADIMAATNQIAINRAFDLKARKVTRLRAPSDPITLTWEFYGDLGRLEYFLRTNRITGDWFFEIPSGTEVVAYV